jgi:hypothetical protein
MSVLTQTFQMKGSNIPERAGEAKLGDETLGGRKRGSKWGPEFLIVRCPFLRFENYQALRRVILASRNIPASVRHKELHHLDLVKDSALPVHSNITITG